MKNGLMSNLEPPDNWNEVMHLARKYGFITVAVAGTAILMDHEEQKKQGIYEKTQRLCGVEDESERQNQLGLEL